MIIRTNGTQKEARVIEVGQKEHPILHYDLEYDTQQPKETLRIFVEEIRDMLARFEGNKARIIEIEAELNDMEHYMEIGKFKNVPEGYKLYRKLAELRRERRACKNENDLLQPIWDHFHATEVLRKLSAVQGECSKIKGVIDSRCYTVRTDVLKEWLEPEKKIDIPEKDGEDECVNTTKNTWKMDGSEEPAEEQSPNGTCEKEDAMYRKVWPMAANG